MQLLFFYIFPIILLSLYGIFGMTLLPESLRRNGSTNTLFLVSPLIGSAVWLALTVGIGILVPYNVFYFSAMLLFAVVWVIWHRKKLFLPENPYIWFLPAVFAFVAAEMSLGIVPSEFDGGLYFTPCIYDHIKCAIINSISIHGLPPVNPWLADGGEPLALVYYFGWHAWAAQLTILTGCDAFLTECLMTGFTFALIMTACTGFVTEMCEGKFNVPIIFCLLLLGFFDFEYTNLAGIFLPESWKPIYNAKEFSGFWNLNDSFLWSPQHMYAAAMVVLILWFHFNLIHSEDVKTSAAYAVSIGLFATAALLNSVYSGAFALACVAAIMMFNYVRHRDFRNKFNRAFVWQVVAVLLCVVLSAMYLKFLFTYPPEQTPVAFGLMPCFGKITSFWQYPLYFLQFYFCILPMRWGLIYILGMIAVLVPGILPEHPLISFCRKFIIISLLVVFFVHSTFYSNDFGWRFVAPAQLLLLVFSAFSIRAMCHFFFPRIHEKRWILYAIASHLAAIFLYICLEHYNREYAPLKYEQSLHQTFARAVTGWKIVQEHTDKKDLVLCNPAGFYNIGRIYVSTESTNVFFSLYANRNTPIADLIFSKCYSEFYPQKDLEQLHNKVVDIFLGNPTKEEADYLADTLKVRALLVTPLDGLWDKPGAIETRFPKKQETEDYKVYWN